MQPLWWTQFQQARNAGANGLALEFNTSDYVVHPESGLKPSRLQNYLRAQLRREGYRIGHVSLSGNFRELVDPGDKASDVFKSLIGVTDLTEIFQALDSLMRQRDPKVAVFVDFAEHLVPDVPGGATDDRMASLLEQLYAWSTTSDQVRATQNLVVLFSYQGMLNSLLRHGSFRTLRIDLPGTEQRTDFLRQLTEPAEDGKVKKFGPLAADLTVDEAARLTAGLRYLDIAEMLQQAYAEERTVERQHIRERKQVAIEALAHGTVEVIEPAEAVGTVVGSPHISEYFELVAQMMKDGETGVPPAILLAGPPGTGKSHFVQVLASQLGWPLLALRNFRDRWLGATEQNLERLLGLLDVLNPAVLWIDEIDQVFGSRNEGHSVDGGTSERVMARIWEFMGGGRHRGKLIWAATTNRPDLLDQAMLDRFPAVLPILHPSPTEVASLLPELAHRSGREFAQGTDFARCSENPALTMPTVRQLQEVVARAGMLTYLDMRVPGAPIDEPHFAEAASNSRPNYDPRQHEFICLRAIQMTTNDWFLPWRNRRGLRPGAVIPDYLLRHELVDADGNVDRLKLGNRLHQLAPAAQRY